MPAVVFDDALRLNLRKCRLGARISDCCEGYRARRPQYNTFQEQRNLHINAQREPRLRNLWFLDGFEHLS